MIAYVNDMPFEIEPGETMLEFLRRTAAAAPVPTMCQDDRLENFGSCRVCSVEVAREEKGETRTTGSDSKASCGGLAGVVFNLKPH